MIKNRQILSHYYTAIGDQNALSQYQNKGLQAEPNSTVSRSKWTRTTSNQRLKGTGISGDSCSKWSYMISMLVLWSKLTHANSNKDLGAEPSSSIFMIRIDSHNLKTKIYELHKFARFTVKMNSFAFNTKFMRSRARLIRDLKEIMQFWNRYFRAKPSLSLHDRNVLARIFNIKFFTFKIQRTFKV